MNTDCSLALFATNDDFTAGRALCGISEVPLSEIDQAARVLAAHRDVPGSTVRAYDKDQHQIGIWLYTNRDICVRLHVNTSSGSSIF